MQVWILKALPMDIPNEITTTGTITLYPYV